VKISVFPDLARQFVSQSQAQTLKSAQTKLSTELATGQTSDPVRHLNADMSVLADMKQKIATAKSYRQTNQEVSHFLDVTQTTLSALKNTATEFLTAIQIGMESELPSTKAHIQNEADRTLSFVVNALNTAVAGRHAFSGQLTSTPPLISPSDLKAEIRTLIGGLTTSNDIQSALEDYFRAGGQFETNAYQGSSLDLHPIQISENTSIRPDFRADDVSIRSLLESTFLSMAAVETPGLSLNDKRELLTAAQSISMTARDQFVDISGQVGLMQYQVEKSQTEISAQISTAELVQNELLTVDAFDTASRLEEINTRIEFLYTVTARARNLSFLEFMR